MMEAPYIPINCGFHDQLLHHATMRDALAVSVLENGVQVKFEARIDDVYTQAGAEYIRFDNGKVYRLDQLVQVNGHDPAVWNCAI